MQEAGEARAQLGYLLFKLAKYQAAEDLFRKEVAARPDDPAAHNNLGAALILRGDVASAIDQFEEALRIAPGHERARRNLAAARERPSNSAGSSGSRPSPAPQQGQDRFDSAAPRGMLPRTILGALSRPNTCLTHAVRRSTHERD